LSDAIAKFLGESELSRSDVIKRMWDYIKGNNLQVLEIGSVGKGLRQGLGAKNFFAHAEGSDYGCPETCTRITAI
ncbi:upstream activation factor subunit spp27-like protein, partial [Trifolium pratense]